MGTIAANEYPHSGWTLADDRRFGYDVKVLTYRPAR